MKVLFTSNVPSPYRVDFFNVLAQYCDLTVLFEAYWAQDRNEKWLEHRNYTFKSIYMKSLYNKTDSAFCPEIIKWYKKIAPDIVVVGGFSTPTGMYFIQYLRRNNMPFLLNCDGGLLKKESRIKKIVKTYFIGGATGWLGTGESCRQYIIYYGGNQQKIYDYPFTSLRQQDILEEPVSESLKSKYRERLGIKEKQVIISVGQFIYRKGYDVLIKAMKDNSNVGIYLIGGIPMLEYKELKAKFALNNLHFISFKKKEELKEFYMAADIFVLPTREDIWGLVINEAMAYGLPVITTTKCVAGLELIKDGENGYLVEPENVDKLKERIETLIEDSALRKKMQKKNLEIIHQYTIENMAKRHMEIFREFL